MLKSGRQKPPTASTKLVAAAALLAGLVGCKPVGPDYQRPSYTPTPLYKETGAATVVAPPPAPQGGSWLPADPSDGMLRGKWWQVFGDPQLNQLEERIATNNLAVRQAMDIYMAAREQVRVAQSAFSPTVSAGPSFTHNQLSLHRPFFNGSGGSSSFNDLQLVGQASWEPDFWGQIRRTVEAARAQAQASAAQEANIELSLEALMASSYLEMRGLDLEQKLLSQDVEELTRQLALTQQLLDKGIDTEADVALAQTQLESTRAQMIDVGVVRAQMEHIVGTIADYKIPNFSLPPSPLDLKLPQIPTGLPSQLLERRPDIAIAERQAAAANAQIGIAISAFYPSITLGATGGFESTHGGNWIQGPSSLWTLGASAVELLVDGGRRHAYTAQARDNFEAAANNYKGVVFLAFNEVEDDLSNQRILEQEDIAQRAAVASAETALRITQQEYAGGVVSELQVLIAENTLIQNQRALATLETAEFTNSVQLIAALGGGWDVSQLPR